MSVTLAIGSRMRLPPASKATCIDCARFSTGTRLPPRLMLPRITICVWIGLPRTAEHSATKVARVIAVVGPLLCSSTTWKW